MSPALIGPARSSLPSPITLFMRCNGRALLLRTLCLLAGLVCLCPAATAQGVPTEQSARAAMVFNFLRFAEFPPESLTRAPEIRLCVAVRDPRQEQALAALAGRKVGGRELTVQPFPPQGGRCHVLFVDTRQRWNAIAGHAAVYQGLTIGTYPGFARDDGMIEIAVHNEGIHFDVNLAEVRRAGFHFSPQMLRLARQVFE